MRWLVLIVTFFVGCGEVTIKIIPLRSRQPVRYYRVHRTLYKPTPTPKPKSTIPPLPPDPRVSDLIRELKS